MSDQEAREVYAAAGLGQAVTLGSRPAVLVVDFSCGFTDPECTLGADMSAEVEATRRLLDAGRAKGLPVIFTTIGYEPSLKDGGLWLQKVPNPPFAGMKGSTSAAATATKAIVNQVQERARGSSPRPVANSGASATGANFAAAASAVNMPRAGADVIARSANTTRMRRSGRSAGQTYGANSRSTLRSPVRA